MSDVPQVKAYKEAIAEARRFIKKAETAIQHIDGNSKASSWEERSKFTPSVHNAAAKRASMDLTRVLVDVRGRRRY